MPIRCLPDYETSKQRIGPASPELSRAQHPDQPDVPGAGCRRTGNNDQPLSLLLAGFRGSRGDHAPPA